MINATLINSEKPVPSNKDSIVLNATTFSIPPQSSLTVDQFMSFKPDNAPSNVGVAFSGGSSRAMIAGAGQLRGLKALSNAKGSLLGQTRAISAVSGGSWLLGAFMYLSESSPETSDDEFLGIYQDPSTYTVDSLNQLSDKNIGRCCISRFSAKDLSLEAVLLIIGGIPDSMVWQILIGIHILSPYGLYSSLGGLPNDFFSYDKTTLQEIISLNPSLGSKKAYLVVSESGKEQRVSRPYFICNAAMFVNLSNERKQYLVPLHSTPFFTGVFSTPPNAMDVHKQVVGGGGVTSFAFNSELATINQQKVTLTQSRQFSLTDIIGTSSSFFAEYLEVQATLWGGNIKHFFEDMKSKLHTYNWDHIMKNIPVGHGRIISKILNRLETLHNKEDEIDNEHLLKVGIDPHIFYKAFKKLASIVPEYAYWPVNNLNTSHDTLINAFADGGNLENTGISALLLYDDISSIIGFVNSSTPLAPTEYGVLDASEQEISGTRIQIDSQVPPLFGYQPYKDKIGYKLYKGDSRPNSPLFKNNQVFPSETFLALLQGLWQVSGNKDKPSSNQHAANYLQSLTTIENTWFGVRAGKKVQVLWIYNNFINDWYQQLSEVVRTEIFNNDPVHYYHFPHYSTLDTQLTPTQINLLASQTSWSVVKGSPTEILNFYQPASISS